MKKIQISSQQAGKAKQLQSFLHNYWRKNHIFVKNKKFLIWQHKKGSFLTYITAKLKDKIVGVIGYIPQSHYDSKLPKNEIFLTISRTTENILPGPPHKAPRSPSTNRPMREAQVHADRLRQPATEHFPTTPNLPPPTSAAK